MDPDDYNNGGNFDDDSQDDWGAQDDYDSQREGALSSWTSSDRNDDYGYDKDGW